MENAATLSAVKRVTAKPPSNYLYPSLLKLMRLEASRLAQDVSGQTLQPAAFVHEDCFGLVDWAESFIQAPNAFLPLFRRRAAPPTRAVIDARIFRFIKAVSGALEMSVPKAKHSGADMLSCRPRSTKLNVSKRQLVKGGA